MNDTDDRADEEHNKLGLMIIEIISSNRDDHNADGNEDSDSNSCSRAL